MNENIDLHSPLFWHVQLLGNLLKEDITEIVQASGNPNISIGYLHFE